MKLIIDKTKIHATRFDYNINRDIRIDEVADEYEIHDFGGIPVPIPVGSRKAKQRVTDIEITGTIEGKAQLPDTLSYQADATGSHLTAKTQDGDIEICDVYFQPSMQTLDSWEVDFIGLPCPNKTTPQEQTI